MNKINKGDLIYDKENSIIGYYTGFVLNPTYKKSGYIECENNNGESYFVSGLATYIKGFGLKFTEDYIVT